MKKEYVEIITNGWHNNHHYKKGERYSILTYSDEKTCVRIVDNCWVVIKSEDKSRIEAKIIKTNNNYELWD